MSDYDALGGDDSDTGSASAPSYSVKQNTTPRGRWAGFTGPQAGALYGGTAGLAMGGPIGLLVGLGAGIVAKKLRDSFLDREARHQQNISAEHQGFSAEAADMMKLSPPDKQRLIAHAQRMNDDGWARLANGDGEGRDMIKTSNDIMQTLMSNDIAQRNADETAKQTFQRGLITSAANSYREEFQHNMDLFNATDQQASKVLDMTSQPGFDANKPFNKAILADMLTMGVNGYYKDAPNFLDAIAEGAPGVGAIIGAAGGGGVGAAIGGGAGTIISGISKALTSKELELTPEDYNRVAINIKKFSQLYANQRMSQLGQASKELDDFAKGTNSLDPSQSIHDYVSGSIRELKMLPLPPEIQANEQPEPGRVTKWPSSKMKTWQQLDPKHRGIIQRNVRPTN